MKQVTFQHSKPAGLQHQNVTLAKYFSFKFVPLKTNRNLTLLVI
jgi:hypothetical protein